MRKHAEKREGITEMVDFAAFLRRLKLRWVGYDLTGPRGIRRVSWRAHKPGTRHDVLSPLLAVAHHARIEGSLAGRVDEASEGRGLASDRRLIGWACRGGKKR